MSINGHWTLDAGHWTRKCLFFNHLNKFKTAFIYIIVHTQHSVMNIEEIYKIFRKQHQKITTDSRKIEKGIIFWALKGDNFDGNKFADTALAEGAAYAVDRKSVV